MITTNTRTHYIIIKQWVKDVKRIWITKSQYQLYKDEVEIKAYNAFITINDIDTNEILFEWRASKIDWFWEFTVDKTLAERNWVCSFWHRHPISTAWECSCAKEYKTLWFIFKDKLKEMWYNIFYDSDITQEMQTAYKQKYNR